MPSDSQPGNCIGDQDEVAVELAVREVVREVVSVDTDGPSLVGIAVVVVG